MSWLRKLLKAVDPFTDTSKEVEVIKDKDNDNIVKTDKPPLVLQLETELVRLSRMNDACFEETRKKTEQIRILQDRCDRYARARDDFKRELVKRGIVLSGDVGDTASGSVCSGQISVFYIASGAIGSGQIAPFQIASGSVSGNAPIRNYSVKSGDRITNSSPFYPFYPWTRLVPKASGAMYSGVLGIINEQCIIDQEKELAFTRADLNHHRQLLACERENKKEIETDLKKARLQLSTTTLDLSTTKQLLTAEQRNSLQWKNDYLRQEEENRKIRASLLNTATSYQEGQQVTIDPRSLRFNSPPGNFDTGSIQYTGGKPGRFEIKLNFFEGSTLTAKIAKPATEAMTSGGICCGCISPATQQEANRVAQEQLKRSNDEGLKALEELQKRSLQNIEKALIKLESKQDSPTDPPSIFCSGAYAPNVFHKCVVYRS